MGATIKAEKKQKVKELKKKLEKSKVVILTNYAGMTVKQISELRKGFFKNGIEYKIVKNSLFKRALKEAKVEKLEELIKGPLAVAFSEEEIVAPAKDLIVFNKDNEKPLIIGGMIEGSYCDQKQIDNISKLPSREELLAKVLGGLQGPIRGLVYVLHGSLRNLVCVLSAIRDKK